MGKNKRRQLEVIDTRNNSIVMVDSQEEIDFWNWCLQAQEMGIIKEFKYQPDSFILSQGAKYKLSNGKDRCLFREHEYTPDFYIVIDKKYINLCDELRVSDPNNDSGYYIDVKGTFQRSDGGRSFSLNQKWMYDKFKIYVHKIIPKEFFKKFGVPKKSCFTQKTNKPRKMFTGYPSMDSIFISK